MNPVQKVPQVVTDVFPCPHCERSFPLKQLLDLHKAIHDRERSFPCEQCNRKFFTKYDLAKHMQTHSDCKPYSCIVCEKQFSRESLLHRHEKIHVDVPKYLCAQCDKTFLTKEDMDIHTEKHNKKRPFSCDICGKGFVFKQVGFIAFYVEICGNGTHLELLCLYRAFHADMQCLGKLLPKECLRYKASNESNEYNFAWDSLLRKSRITVYYCYPPHISSRSIRTARYSVLSTDR